MINVCKLIFLGSLAGAGFVAMAAEKTVVIDRKQMVAKERQTSLPSEQALRFKKIFLFPSLDDLSGAMAPRLDEKLIELFTKNTRFDLVRDPQVMKALNPDESAYAKVAQNQLIHREAARVTGADTTVILRTRNVGNSTEMVLEFRDANGDLMFSEVGSVPGYSPIEARWATIESLYNTVMAKLPFDGAVTGRTAGSLTIDLGMKSVKVGDELDVARIVSVQRHPLLRTIVGTDYVRVGKARVTAVDKVLSFAEVIEESPGEYVATGNKILSNRHSVQAPVVSAPIRAPKNPAPSKNETVFPEDERLKGDFDIPKPRYGQIGLSLGYGSLSLSHSTGGQASEMSGSGLGGNFTGQLWITRDWIADIYYGTQGSSLSGGGQTGSANWKRFDFFGGYRFFPNGVGEHATVIAGLGYQSEKFNWPDIAAVNVGGTSYSGIALKLDAEVKLNPLNMISTGFAFEPFSSLKETGAVSLGTPESATVVVFHLEWNYMIMYNLWAKLGIQYDAASGSYSNSATVSDKRFAIGPGISYAF